MSKDKIIVPFNKKKPKSEDVLQAQMFVELEQLGHLKVKQIGATVDIVMEGITLARICYLDKIDAMKVQSKMNDYFILNDMTGWNAEVNRMELY